MFVMRAALLVSVAAVTGQTWSGSLSQNVYYGSTCSGSPTSSSTQVSATLIANGCTCGGFQDPPGSTTVYQRNCHTCNGALIQSTVVAQQCNADCSSCVGAGGTLTYDGNGVDPNPLTCAGYTLPGAGALSIISSSMTGGSLAEYLAAYTDCTAPPPSSPPGGPPAVPPPDADPCFPSSSSVTLADGATKRLDALQVGDTIVAATAEGALTTDTVSLLSIANPDKSAASYISLMTAANASLTVTAGHHLPVGPSCCASLKHAKDVHLGETVWVAESGATRPTTVTAKSAIKARGLHSPVLTHGSFPVIDGVVTSFDSMAKVTLAKHGLAPLLSACKLTGSCDTFRSMFLHEA